MRLFVRVCRSVRAVAAARFQLERRAHNHGARSLRAQMGHSLVLAVVARCYFSPYICLFLLLFCLGASSVTLHRSSGSWLMLASLRLSRGHTYTHTHTHAIVHTGSITLEHHHAPRVRTAIEGC